MIIYNVTVKVTHKIAADWLRWMKEEHMPELLRTGLFIESRLCRLLEQDESDGITYAAQYHLDSLEDYQAYIKEHADGMRQKGLRKFGDQAIAFRSVLEVVG